MMRDMIIFTQGLGDTNSPVLKTLQMSRLCCRRLRSVSSVRVRLDHLLVEEKFPKENFRVNREMRDEILVYDLFLTKFWAKMASKCRENSVKIWILGFRF